MMSVAYKPIMFSVIMLSVIMLSVIMQSVIMLSVYAKCHGSPIYAWEPVVIYTNVLR
jgi:hypothetical protein